MLNMSIYPIFASSWVQMARLNQPFFQVFGFLRNAMTSNVNVALAKLGGSRAFREVRSRNSTGPIEIELKFRAGKESPLTT
jgi:hypothetical protein